MAIDRNDPRLTAYALGELDETAHAEIEALLINDPEAQAEVEAIRAVGSELSALLSAGPDPVLSSDQYEKITDAAQLGPAKKPKAFPHILRLVAVAAACICIVALVSRSRKQNSAMAYRDIVEETPVDTAEQAVDGTNGMEIEQDRRAPAERRRSARSAQTQPVVDPGSLTTTRRRDPDTSALTGAPPVKTKLAPAGDELSIQTVAVAPKPKSAPAPTEPATPRTERETEVKQAVVATVMDHLTVATAPEMQGKKVQAAPRSKRPAPMQMKIAHVVAKDAKPAPKMASTAIVNEKSEKQVRGLPLSALASTRTEQEHEATGPGFGREAYDHIADNPFRTVGDEPLSTFSIDVNTASYANVRRFLSQNSLPPRDAVRIEELVNYFPYSYEQPQDEHPFAVNVDVGSCPWNPTHRLAKIGLKGRDPDADKGNGNYAYIDTAREARKVLVEQVGATLITIAKDVKIQVEFNPAQVAAYRLIGYENRKLANQDFNDDTKDAGEIGAGHTVTAFYEIVPAGAKIGTLGVDQLKYQTVRTMTGAATSGELLTVKLRYKQPAGSVSSLLTVPVMDGSKRWSEMNGDFQFASAVALFGMVLRDSPHCGSATLDLVAELATSGVGSDQNGYRKEFVELVSRAKTLKR